MSEMTVTVEHKGTTYYGHVAAIKSTSLSLDPVMTAYVHCEWKGGGVGVGGFALDTPRQDENGKHLGRVGSAYGADQIIRIMETVGVHNWEDLPGKHVVALFKERNSLGSISVGLAGATNGKVLILKEHAEEFRAMIEQP